MYRTTAPLPGTGERDAARRERIKVSESMVRAAVRHGSRRRGAHDLIETLRSTALEDCRTRCTWQASGNDSWGQRSFFLISCGAPLHLKKNASFSSEPGSVATLPGTGAASPLKM